MSQSSSKSGEMKYELALIYCRVSSKRQKTEGHGLESQKQRCIAHADRKGYQVEEVFMDDFTGGGDFMQRPEMARLLAYLDARPHKNYVVIFDDLSRFARDTIFHLKLAAAFKVRGVKRECLNFSFDESPEGVYSETIMAANGQLDREKNKRQVVQKMKARLETGYWTFGTKKGYKMTKSPGRGRLAVPNHEGLEMLKPVLEGFATGKFLRKLDAAQALVDLGFWGENPQHADKYIHRVDKLLRDPFYAGFIEYPEWEVVRRQGEHEALISEEVFRLIQKRLRPDGLVKRIRVDISDDFPLRGLLVCSCCANSLTAAWSKGRNGQYGYYKCQNKGCEMYGKSAPKERPEEQFDSLLGEATIKPEAEALIQIIFDRTWANALDAHQKRQDALSREQAENKEKIRQLAEMVRTAKSAALRLAYEEQIEDAMKESDGLTSYPLSVDNASLPYRTALNRALGILKNPRTTWNEMSTMEKHGLFFFLFEQKLPYHLKEGYRTERITSAAKLFEEFVDTNPHDVEMRRRTFNRLGAYLTGFWGFCQSRPAMQNLFANG